MNGTDLATDLRYLHLTYTNNSPYSIRRILRLIVTGEHKDPLIPAKITRKNSLFDQYHL